jgi:hypothetical protein
MAYQHRQENLSTWGGGINGSLPSDLVPLDPGYQQQPRTARTLAPVSSGAPAGRPMSHTDAPDRDPAKEWSASRLDKARRACKRVVFDLWLCEALWTAEMLFFIPETARTPPVSAAFHLKVNDDNETPAAFMFTQSTSAAMQPIEDYYEGLTAPDGFKGMRPSDAKSPTRAISIHRVWIDEVVDNRPATEPRPTGLYLTGIQNRHQQAVACSWNKKARYQAIINRRETAKMVYSSEEEASPHVVAIHGTESCETNKAGTAANWGVVSNKCYAVPIMSAYGVFLFYYLVDLCDSYSKKQSRGKKDDGNSREVIVPPEMPIDRYEEMTQVHEKWLHANEEAGRSSQIYQKDADLTDGYIGRVIEALSPSNGTGGRVAWTIERERPYFRVPASFIEEIVVPAYDSHVNRIVMSSPTKMGLRAEYRNDNDKTAEKKSDGCLYDVFFTVQAEIFPPRMIYTIVPFNDYVPLD